ncbi:MAG: hypothetical protein ACYTXI_29480 [Nostoc sp.]
MTKNLTRIQCSRCHEWHTYRNGCNQCKDGMIQRWYCVKQIASAIRLVVEVTKLQFLSSSTHNITPSSIVITITSSSNSCSVFTASFDCINGTCIDASKFNTPGMYSSLSECETACGIGCNGKCISNSKWAQQSSVYPIN